MSHPGWLCFDCNICTLCINEYYMVLDKIWDKHGVDLDMLCIGCLEARMNKQLKRKDFNKFSINHDPTMHRSERLQDRLSQ